MVILSLRGAALAALAAFVACPSLHAANSIYQVTLQNGSAAVWTFALESVAMGPLIAGGPQRALAMAQLAGRTPKDSLASTSKAGASLALNAQSSLSASFTVLSDKIEDGGAYLTFSLADSGRRKALFDLVKNGGSLRLQPSASPYRTDDGQPLSRQDAFPGSSDTVVVVTADPKGAQITIRHDAYDFSRARAGAVSAAAKP